MDKLVNDRPANTMEEPEDHLVAGEYGYWEVEEHENMQRFPWVCVLRCAGG